MPRGRSPNYPGLTLAEALERVKRIYAVEHTHPTAKEVVAKAIGYSTLNGASLTVIGALRRYRLLEAAGEGLRVSDDAVALIELPETEPDYRTALNNVAFAPELFAELRTQFGSKLPSEASLRHSLIKKSFLPKAADEVIRVYRENLKLVGFSDSEYHEPLNDTQANGEQAMNLLTSGSKESRSEQSRPSQVAMNSPARSYTVDISIPRNVKAELRIIGEELKREDLERLKKQLMRLVENMEDAFSD